MARCCEGERGVEAGGRGGARSRLAVLVQDGVDLGEGLVDLLAELRCERGTSSGANEEKRRDETNEEAEREDAPWRP